MHLTSSRIPDSLRFAFQEYNLEQLNLKHDQFTIIERTLAYGNRSEIRWLFKYYGPVHLKSWLLNGGWRTLPRRRLLLWTLYFELPSFPTRRGVWSY